MDPAVVRIGARRGKGIRELLLRIQNRRFESFTLRTYNIVWHVILVDPGHCRVGRDGESCRPETEVIDLDLVLLPRTVLFAGSRPGMAGLRYAKGHNEQGNGCYTQKRCFHFS